MLSFMRGWVASRPEDYRLVSTASDVHRCKAEGKLVSFDIEGMNPVLENPSSVQTFYELGVRVDAHCIQSQQRSGWRMPRCRRRPDRSRAGRHGDEMERVGMVLAPEPCGRENSALKRSSTRSIPRSFPIPMRMAILPTPAISPTIS